MLTQTERNGLKEILDSLDDEDLFRLLETVTKRMFSVARNRSGKKHFACFFLFIGRFNLCKKYLKILYIPYELVY